ncbi:MAG: hypothetical protein HPY50_02145 [Firmicutes bacterium]|nr:hypothetical protein [Bacillota bacterium]
MKHPSSDTGHRIQNAITRLRSLYESDLAVPDLEACGKAVVEPLREFLFTREPSGIFYPRCKAAEVLAALGAKDILIDFLANPRSIADPVEEAGEDAVASAVALALLRWPDEQVFSLLLDVARRKLLVGVVEALGEYRRYEAVPIFASALGEDFCRYAAQNALRKLGEGACPYLLQLANRKTTSDTEYESSRRQRRSALELLAELYQGEHLPETVWLLMEDDDPEIALLACSICLPRVSLAGREKVFVRLIDLLDSTDWMFRSEVEDLLIENYANCRSVIERRLNRAIEPAASSLRRIVSKACSKGYHENG